MSALPSREAIVHRFRLSAGREDLAVLSELLHPEVVALVDGAGDVIAPTTARHGPSEVISEVVDALSARSGTIVAEQPVNGAPALVVRSGARVVAILSFGIEDGLITRVWITRSPQKLQRWNSPG